MFYNDILIEANDSVFIRPRKEKQTATTPKENSTEDLMSNTLEKNDVPVANTLVWLDKAFK